MARGNRRPPALQRTGRLDPDALEGLDDENGEALLAYLLRRTGSAEHAADLLADEELIDLARAPSLVALVDDLPVEQRHAVLARIVDERSYVEIAASQSCSQAAARQRVSRGLSRLASWVKEAR